jgi:ADP-heptose:LPS heptosyltransferase
MDTPCPAIFENNPYDNFFDGGERIKLEYPLINECGQRPVHFMQGYTDFLGEKLGISLKLNTNRPFVYLTEAEKQSEPNIKKPFWLMNAGVKPDYTCKAWNKYQELVDILQGKINFIQIGERHHIHKALRGSVDYLGKTSLRELIVLAYHAEGGVGPCTYLMHLMASLEKPYVCVAGAREPESWNSYPRQTYISTVGCLPCGRSPCWKSRVEPLNDGDCKNGSICELPVLGDVPAPKCTDIISASTVAEAILRYL